ncbi:MAG: hypothetical protein DCC68_11550 [Planctomycetota bacterium]|nr:MAG: hypothetical protein DCC68_11550 [Planctomycetota bacterium]
MKARRREQQRIRSEVELEFDGLRGTKWRLTSKQTPRYNCIAWAVGEKHRPWDLLRGYWPDGVPRTGCLTSLIAAYQTKGFEICDEAPLEYDQSFDKVVLYGVQTGSGHEWQHAAKLMPNGMWSSKLGNWVDIQHEQPEHVNHADYGEPLVYMRKAKRCAATQSSKGSRTKVEKDGESRAGRDSEKLPHPPEVP